MFEDRITTLGSHNRENLPNIKQKQQKNEVVVQRKNVLQRNPFRNGAFKQYFMFIINI